MTDLDKFALARAVEAAIVAYLAEVPAPLLQAPSDKVYGTVADAASYMNCSEKTIRRYLAQGRLTSYRFGPHMVRVDLAELEAIVHLIPNARTGRGHAETTPHP